jgi:tryptophanyl-tRNA synthetase
MNFTENNNNINKVSDTGYWLFATESKEHYYDPKLCNAIIQLLLKNKVESIYDFGCGHGKYTNEIVKAVPFTTGFDGNPHTNLLPNCVVQDLTIPFQKEKVDSIMCLEVAEHIPKELEGVLLSNIHDNLKSNGLLVISWAVEGQGGLGHVNCRNNDYVKNTLNGYTFLEEESEVLRKESGINWFKGTLMVFRKK